MHSLKPTKARTWKSLVSEDNPVLRAVAAPVNMHGADGRTPSMSQSELFRLVNDMLWIMAKNNGVGLAAPQIGVSLRVIVMNCGERYAMIDPVIQRDPRNQQKGMEGCLTFPGKQVEVIRANSVKVSFHDINGKLRQKNFTGLEARCVQHEMDHLDGKLLTDYEYADN